MSSLNTRYLEFENVSVDLRHVSFTRNTQCPGDNKRYIIFLNVKKAFYSNFEIESDLSLETLTMYIYHNVRIQINNCVLTLNAPNKHIAFNEVDYNQSLFIEPTPNDEARIIVAQTIYSHESYHQRITGYMDFERRRRRRQHYLSTEERALNDRNCEAFLLS